jgi:hypothetical protein
MDLNNNSISTLATNNPNQMIRDCLRMPNLTDEVISRQSDMVQIMLHNIQNIDKNKNIASFTQVNVTKSRNIPEGAWNDVYVMEQLNKISTFDESIVAYKRKLLNVTDPINCFTDLKDVSKELTLSILKTLRLRDRGEDLQEFINVLSIAQGDSQEFKDFLPFYNILLYSVPYAFSLAATDLSVNFMLNFSPYDFCAHTLQTLNLDLVMGDITWHMRLQAKLEGSMPDIGRYRDLYDALRPVVNRGMFMYNHRYQYLMLGSFSISRHLLLFGLRALEPELSVQTGDVSPRVGTGDVPPRVGTGNSNVDIIGEIIWQLIVGDYNI